MTRLSNYCAIGIHDICDGGFTGGRCKCECHAYKFSIGRQVTFTIEVGPFARPKTRTMHGKVTGRYTGPTGNPSYEITLDTIKRAGRKVPVYRGISEKDIREREYPCLSCGELTARAARICAQCKERMINEPEEEL